jgi:hypothetical protein
VPVSASVSASVSAPDSVSAAELDRRRKGNGADSVAHSVLMRAPMPPVIRLSTSLALCAFLGAATGCTPSSDVMREPATPHAAKAPPDQALVVFVRPSSFALLAKYEVVDVPQPAVKDAAGHVAFFLGESIANSHFAVAVPPGDHVFVAYHGSDPIARNDAMRATLAPGRTYFVEISPHMGGVDILAITPRSDSWAKVTAWLQDTKQLVPDRAAGQAQIDEDDDLPAEVTAAFKHLADDDAEELAERTITPGDGIQ